MEELKLLVEMVANLPSMAMWVIAFFFVYKVVVIGSIYGLIRFAIDKMHSWLTGVGVKQMRPMIDRICITGNEDDFATQLKRLRGKGSNIGSEYVHKCSVEWLRDAIDEKEQRESQARKVA